METVVKKKVGSVFIQMLMVLEWDVQPMTVGSLQSAYK